MKDINFCFSDLSEEISNYYGESLHKNLFWNQKFNFDLKDEKEKTHQTSSGIKGKFLLLKKD